MTDEDVFREAYLAGMTRRELREKFGINDKRIDTLRRKLDLPVRRCVRKAPPEGFEDFAGKPGVSIPMIRQTYGCSEDVASRWVRECGVKLQPRTKPLPLDWEEVAPTMTGVQLAKHYGVANTVISRWLTETSLTPKAYKPRGSRRPRAKAWRLPPLPVTRTAPVTKDEAAMAATYLRRFYTNVFRCDILQTDRKTWGEMHGVPNKGRDHYHVDRLGILANDAVIELAYKKGWRQC